MISRRKKLTEIFLFLILLFLPMLLNIQPTRFKMNSHRLVNSSSTIYELEDFFYEEHNAKGLDIEFIDEYLGYGSGIYCDQYIHEGPFGDHYKVLIMRDAQGAKYTESVHYLDKSMSLGLIEFSLWLNSAGSCTNPHHHYIKFRDSTDLIAFQLRFDLYSNKAYYYTGSDWTLIATVTRAEWYKYIIDFNKNTLTFNIEIIKETTSTVVGTITNANYENNVFIEEVYLGTTKKDYSGNTRWDNFIFSDPNSIPFPMNLISPEEKNYTKPMQGYYPATYGFENDAHWSHPEGWEVLEGAGGPPACHVRIEDFMDDDWNGIPDDNPVHKKILRLADASSSGECKVTQHFSSSSVSGGVEFWFQTDNAIKVTNILIFDGSSPHFQINLMIYLGLIWYKNNDDTTFIPTSNPIYSNRWYHFKITFECGSGHYDYLFSDHYNLYIDGSKKLNLQFSGGGVNYLDTLVFRTNGPNDWYSSFFDAISYTWDPYYQLGDNLNEGLLIDYTPKDLNVMKYSIDGHTPLPIQNIEVIPYPDYGKHSIQVFGRDVQNNWYQSELIYFTISPITITSIEDNMFGFTNIDNYYYPGSCTFETDEDGEDPEGWIITEPSGCGYVEVDASLKGHKKVVEVRKTYPGTSRVAIEKQFEDNPTIGTVEYWLYKDTDSGIDGTIMYLLGDVGSAYFLIENGNLYRGPYPSRVLIASDVFSANDWHRFRIDFDISQGYQIYLDGILYGEGYSLQFDGAPSYIKGFRLRSHYSGCHSNYGAWLDAFGYSWDPYYNIGDNRYEGLNLTFTGHEYLDWMGYSLNNQDIVEIPGNYVIPITPINGYYTIQVFGKVEEDYCESEKKQFFLSYLNDYTQRLDWGIDAINAEIVWGGVEDATYVEPGNYDGDGIKILIIDSGIDYNHPDLDDNYQEGASDYIDGDLYPMDGYGHGTHCAGILAAEDNNLGGIGVAPNAEIYMARVMNNYGYPEDPENFASLVADVIEWATNTHYDDIPDNEIDIVSMSIGIDPEAEHLNELETACQNAYDAGIILVAAAGNYKEYIEFPAAFESVIAVGAVDPDLNRASISNFGDELFIVAPGVYINSPCIGWYDNPPDNGYEILNGTSMACPMVAGVCALMLSKDPNLTPDQIRTILINTANKVGGVQYDENGWNEEYGYGMVDAEAAVNAV